MKKTIHMMIISIGFLLLIYAVFAAFLLIWYPQQSTLTFWNFYVTDRLLSKFAEIGAFAATGLWITKTAFFYFTRRGVKPIEMLKQLFLLFQKHHVLIGWGVLITTSAHGLYYILHQSDRMNMMITGWIAWFGLIFLGFIGVFFDQWLKEKKKTKRIRIYHIGFSIIFLIGFVLHVF